MLPRDTPARSSDAVTWTSALGLRSPPRPTQSPQAAPPPPPGLLNQLRPTHVALGDWRGQRKDEGQARIDKGRGKQGQGSELEGGARGRF